jgi:hypothetical protein
MSAQAGLSSSDGKTLGEVLAIAGGGLLVVGAFLPWVSAEGPFVSIGRSGMVAEDFLIFLGTGVVIASLGLWAGVAMRSAAPALLVVGGVATGIAAFLDYRDVARNIEEINDGRITYLVGEGIWVLFAGALASVVAGFVLSGRMSPVAPATGAGAIEGRPADTSVITGRKWRPVVAIAAIALVVVLLVALSIINARTGDWWSHDGFAWCDRNDGLCMGGVEIIAT